jgi:hypothetical protein
MIALVFIAALSAQTPSDQGTTGVASFIPAYKHARWARAPSLADLARVKPASPMRGVAGFDCSVNPNGGLEHCKQFDEQPKELGFGEAAQGLLPKFELSKADAKFAREQHQRVRVWIAFGGSEGCFFPYCTADPPPPPVR